MKHPLSYEAEDDRTTQVSSGHSSISDPNPTLGFMLADTETLPFALLSEQLATIHEDSKRNTKLGDASMTQITKQRANAQAVLKEDVRLAKI
jgi:hypothetical protein